MNIKRLQRLNKEFFQKATDAEVDAKKLSAEASTADEVIDTFKVRYIETELRIGFLTTENEKMKKEVHQLRLMP